MTSAGIINRERMIKSFVVSGILLISVLIIITVDNILISIVLAFVINYLLAPIVNAAERGGISRKAAVAALYFLLAVAAVACVYLLLPAVSLQLLSLKNELPQFVDGTTKLLAATEARINAILFNVYEFDSSQAASRVLSTISGRIFEDLPQFISTSLSVLALAPFFAFFMLLDGQAVAKKALTLVPNNLFELALNLKHQINAQLGGFIRARLLEAGIVGFVVWLGLAVVGFPYAILLAIFAGLTNLIPYIGPIIGAIPAILIGMVTGMSGWVLLAVVGVYAAAQLVDNFLIIPLVVARIVNLHPVAVVIVIIVGAQMAGILGMIISIPVACILKITAVALYEHLVEFNS